MIPASVGFQCPECVRGGNASVRSVRSGRLRAAADRWGAVTLSLIGINVAMFLVTAASAVANGASPLDNYDSPLFDALAQAPGYVIATGEWWRLITAAFLHFGLIHLVFNMLALLLFGAELERAIGRGRFLTLYLVSALGGATAIQLFAPNVLAAGASTAIYGILGGLGVVFVASRQSLRGLIQLLVINLLISLLPGISLIGHLGGLVAGALTAGILVLARRRPELQIIGVAVLAVVLVALAVTGRTG
jgi:membrane associated rhomboid family serine protease